MKFLLKLSVMSVLALQAVSAHGENATQSDASALMSVDQKLIRAYRFEPCRYWGRETDGWGYVCRSTALSITVPDAYDVDNTVTALEAKITQLEARIAQLESIVNP
jgi:hypothetical protein